MSALGGFRRRGRNLLGGRLGVRMVSVGYRALGGGRRASALSLGSVRGRLEENMLVGERKYQHSSVRAKQRSISKISANLRKGIERRRRRGEGRSRGPGRGPQLLGVPGGLAGQPRRELATAICRRRSYRTKDC